MVPSSREKGRGAYRDLMMNYINGIKDSTLIVHGRGNKIVSKWTSFNLLDIGLMNYIRIRKRTISTEEKTFTMGSSITAGDKNSIYIAYWNDEQGDYSTSLSVGDNNNVEVVLYERDDISIGSRNHIRGKMNISSSGTTIGDDNILIDFTPEITTGSTIYGYPELSELMFETEIVSIASEGSMQIEVADTSKVMLGNEIFFGTLGAAFADRIVTSVNGNFIGFETPLSSKEVTIVSSRVFNHYPETVEVFNSSLSEDVSKGSKRIMLSDLGSLHLRDITIDGTFETKSFFQRSSDNMVIIRDSTDKDYQAGTSVVSDGEYPYMLWDTEISLESGSTYFVNSPKHSAHIGRVVNVDGIDYHIIGFTSTTITLNEPVPIESTALSFSPISEAPGGGPSSTTLTENSAGNSMIIQVQNSSTFFIGQILRVSEIVKLFSIVSISANTITLNEKIFGDSIDNSFYVGVVELPIDIVTTKASIEAGALDLNTYIFGEL